MYFFLVHVAMYVSSVSWVRRVVSAAAAAAELSFFPFIVLGVFCLVASGLMFWY